MQPEHCLAELPITDIPSPRCSTRHCTVAGAIDGHTSLLSAPAQVDLAASSLNTHDVCVVDSEDTIFQFNGQSASAAKRGRAHEVSQAAQRAVLRHSHRWRPGSKTTNGMEECALWLSISGTVSRCLTREFLCSQQVAHTLVPVVRNYY